MVVLGYFILVLLVAGLLILNRNKVCQAALVCFFAFLQAGLTAFAFTNRGETDSGYFTFDSTATIFLAVLAITGIPALYHSHLYLSRKGAEIQREGKYYAALILLMAAIAGSYLSNHLAVLWACIEITTFATAFLIDFNRTKPGLEAAWKYLFIASIGVTLAFMGILFFSAIASNNHLDTLFFNGLSAIRGNINPIIAKAVFLLILVGLSIKMNIVPLHAATVDAKTILPSPANAIVSTALVNVGFIAIYRVFGLLGHSSSLAWMMAVMRLTGVISVGLAAIQLFRVKRMKRMLAFSSMEHIGIVLVALSCGQPGYYAAILHIVLHSLVKAGLFFQSGQTFYIFGSVWFKDSGNLMKIYPPGALVLLFGILSAMAIPPSGMFASELLTFFALINNGYFVTFAFLVFFLVVIIYVISKFTFGVVFGATPEGFEMPGKPSLVESLAPLSLFAIASYLGFVQPAFLKETICQAIQFLM
jgi:hydrogenase-4 component F